MTQRTRDELCKILRGAAIAATGAVLTYATIWISGRSFGEWTPAVTALFAILVQTIRKLVELLRDPGEPSPATSARFELPESGTPKDRGPGAAAVLLALLLLAPAGARAQMQAPGFSHGPTVPLFAVRWDSTGDAVAGILNQGAGYSFNFNFLPSEDSQIRWATVGLPVFFRTQGGEIALSAGATLGTFNNLFALGVAVDLLNVDGEDSGALLGRVGRENVAILVNFAFNLGGGSQPKAEGTSRSAQARPQDKTPPPGYVRFGRQ